MYNVFIEGLEGSGKSYLSELIQKQIPNSEIIQFPSKKFRKTYLTKKKAPQNIQELFYIAMLNTVNNLNKNITYIFDRGFITQQVFNDHLTNKEITKLKLNFKKLNNRNILIYLNLNLNSINQNLKHRVKEFNNQNGENIKKQKEIRLKYERVIRHNLLNYRRNNRFFDLFINLQSKNDISNFNIDKELKILSSF